MVDPRARIAIRGTHFWAAVLIALGALLTLRTFGRPWWCACGSWMPWSFDINGSHNSQHWVDPYSVSHFEHGLLFFVFLLLLPKLEMAWRWVCAIGLECGWELLENSSFIIDRYRAGTVSADYYGDSVLNSFSDVIFAGLGFVAAWWLFRRPQLRWRGWWGVIALCEVGLIVAVRDSLMINIVMLVHPIEALRTWQSS